MQSKEELAECLKSLGMEQEEISCVVETFAKERNENALSKIRSFRTRELEKVHAAKEKLYCIDFLIKELERQTQ